VNVPIGFLPVVRLVGLLAELVIIRGEDALGSLFFEGDAETSDATEEVNEAGLLCSVYERVLSKRQGASSLYGLDRQRGFFGRFLAVGGGGCSSGQSGERLSLKKAKKANLSRTGARI
jgi:hypothetical protein